MNKAKKLAQLLVVNYIKEQMTPGSQLTNYDKDPIENPAAHQPDKKYILKDNTKIKNVQNNGGTQPSKEYAHVEKLSNIENS